MVDENRIAQFRRLVEDDPSDDLAQYSLGAAMLEAGQAAEAVPCFQRVIALNSRHSRAHLMLGRAQQAAGDAESAKQTLIHGYRVAQRNGDMMPLREMAALLTELGAEPPRSDARPVGQPAGTTDAGFACRRCGGGSALKEQPFKGELGEQILASVCQNCWNEWVQTGTRVINELRLSMSDPKSQELYDRHMKEFLMIE